MTVVVPANQSTKRFKVALSFPGEKRPFVSQVAEGLVKRFGRHRVFYDKNFEPELARPNLDLHLQGIYHDDSELIVVFLCQEYDKKEWCGLEWRAVRDIIKQRRDEDIMLMSFDHVQVPGLFSIDGYIDLDER